MLHIKRYCCEDYEKWNEFNTTSKNGLFMFDRNYMDYHKERFKDHSLMFYDNEILVAMIPFSERENVLISHGGLTYGGFILDDNSKQHDVIDFFDLLLDYCKKNGFKEIYYKQIPYLYHKQPAEEDRYALFLMNAVIEKIEPATVVNLRNPL